jgi:hypothetical protein
MGKMSDEPSPRLNVATWVGVVFWLILLESHTISRPFVFLLGPFIVIISIVVIAPRVFAKRWQRTLLIATASSAGSFLLTKYVFG